MSDSRVLQWKGHHNFLLEQMFKFLRKSQFVDCVLTAEGKTLGAHRAVLACASPYFYRIFKLAEANDPVVILNQISYADLLNVIAFVYTGHVDVELDKLQQFREMCLKLEMKGIEGFGIDIKKSMKKPVETTEAETSKETKTKKSFKGKKEAAKKMASSLAQSKAITFNGPAEPEKKITPHFFINSVEKPSASTTNGRLVVQDPDERRSIGEKDNQADQKLQSNDDDDDEDDDEDEEESVDHLSDSDYEADRIKLAKLTTRLSSSRRDLKLFTFEKRCDSLPFLSNELICKFCNNSRCNKISTLKSHQRFCKKNPNRKINMCKLCKTEVPSGSMLYHKKKIHGEALALL